MPKLLTCTGAAAEAFKRFWTRVPEAAAEPDRPRRARVRAVLVRAVQAFAEECRERKVAPEYVPHARTWLADCRYLDYLAAANRAGGTHRPQEADAPSGVPGDPRLRPLAEAMSRAEYETWIAPLEVRGDGQIVSPTPMHRDWVRNHYGELIRGALGLRVPPSFYTRPYNAAGKGA